MRVLLVEDDDAIAEPLADTLDANLLYVAVPVASGGVIHGAVRVTFPTSAVDARVRRNWITLALIGAATLGAAAVAGFALSRWVVRPLQDLERATTALGRGALDTRIATDAGPPEVRRLSAAVNETAARLEALVGAQEAFVADASHQLRTPLTSLRLRLELLEGSLAHIPDAEAEVPGVAAALREVARLSRLVDGLLALARAERTGASATADTLDLRDVLRERADAWGPVADDEGVVLEMDGSSVMVRATPDRVAQVIDNLLANAIEVAPEGSVVTLWAARGPTGPELHVADRGPGLPDEERERAFDRFWSGRGGTRRLGGSGLGLAIVRKLVEADGGTVELRARAAGGIDATVVLPTAAHDVTTRYSGNMPRRGSSV
jgi:signal transduction histidine kinase